MDRARELSEGWARYPGLRRRPATPNKGRGRLQQQVRRAFAAAGMSELTSSAIYDWTNARDRKRPSTRARYSVWRVLREVATPIGRASTRGRPWIWRVAEMPSAPPD
jgi:hypothetical protein